MAWGMNGTPDTLSGTSDTMTISDLTEKKFNQILSHELGTGGNIGVNLNFGYNSIDTGSNYALRYQANGVNGSQINKTYVAFYPNGGSNSFHIVYLINIATEEKLLTAFSVEDVSTGAGAAPQRMEYSAKYVNTSNQINQTRISNELAGDLAIGSNLTVLTGDETETVTLQNGTIFEETDTNKAYIWNSSTKTWTQL